MEVTWIPPQVFLLLCYPLNEKEQHSQGKFKWKTLVSPMVGCWHFSNLGAVAALQPTFLFSLAPIQTDTRGSDQNIQAIGS